MAGQKTFTENLLEGIAAYLAADTTASVPLAWLASGNYGLNASGIYVIDAPVVQGPRPLTLVIRPYYSENALSLSDSTLTFQLDFYGPKRDVVRSVDDVLDRLHGYPGGTIGGVKVQSIERTSGAVLGLDEGGNHRQTENYDLAAHRPSSHRQ